MPSLNAIQAYRKSATHRSIREQEAGVFRLVNRTLRNAQTASPTVMARAVADNERLWVTLMDILGDPSNQLPDNTRAALLSVGHAVRREVKAAEPDLGFLITINDQIASGLSGA